MTGEQSESPTAPEPSRRGFLKMGGAALAGAVIGGAGGAAIGVNVANQRKGFVSDPDPFAALTPVSYTHLTLPTTPYV